MTQSPVSAASEVPQRLVGIAGSYGGLNLGDEAILQSIIAGVRPEASIVVFSRNADDTRRRHRVKAVAVREMTRHQSREVISKLDVLVFGGGGLLFDDEAELFLREVLLAHEATVPVVVYGISSGPLRQHHVRRHVRDALNGCAAITVRDRHGLQLLQDIGVNVPVELTADPALLLDLEDPPSPALRREVDPSARLVALSVREPGPAAPDLDIDHYHALVANAADFVIDRFDAEVVFVPMERHHVDLQHSHAIVAKMQNAARSTVLHGEYTPAEICSFLRRCEFAIGMRLHFLIFAALAGVPFVSLPYASKVSGFIEDLHLPTLPLRDLNAGILLAHIDRSWDVRAELRQRVAEHLPILQGRATRNREVLSQILAGQGVACRR